ncbi:MAG: HAMP domain-containing sensor histidine kinase, partial [Bacteroidota bacterium]
LINNSLIDLDRLESLVDNILFAAKIERDHPGFSNEEVNISEIVHRITERFSQNKKAIVIETDVQPEVYMKVDIIGFTSVITNLVENAIKYSESGTAMKVILKEQEENILLMVKDNGIGISNEEKPRVFDKFYRVGNEDTRRTKGTGLGLYIVKRIAEIYKADISIEDNTPTGSVFKLSFPK